MNLISGDKPCIWKTTNEEKKNNNKKGKKKKPTKKERKKKEDFTSALEITHPLEQAKLKILSILRLSKI